MSEISNYDRMLSNIFPDRNLYDLTSKKTLNTDYISYMTNRCLAMFQWEGLPDTIPQRIIELYLICRGYAAVCPYNDDLYVFFGGLGGEPDVYYMPTIFTVANPALNYNANLKIDKECIVINNDSLYMGLIPLFRRYASLLSENVVSLRVAMINSRILNLISSGDDRTTKSAKAFLKEIEDGKLGLISSNEFLEGIKSTPYGSDGHYNTITSLIELHQYYKASWYNELGLNANYNMKRESISRGESQLNNDALLPLVDDMLNCRKKAAEKINDMFGTSISVDFASSWKDNIEEIDAELDDLKSGNDPDNDPDNDPSGGVKDE